MQATVPASAAPISRLSPAVSEGRAAGLQAVGLIGVVGAGVLLAATSLRLPVLCPLRLLTGVPCPLCGMTTGTVAFLRGDLGASVAAAPLSLAVVPAAVAGFVQRVRTVLSSAPARQWSRAARRGGLAVLLAALAGSWVYQLFRFGIL